MESYLAQVNKIVAELIGVGDKIEDGDLSMTILPEEDNENPRDNDTPGEASMKKRGRPIEST